MNTFTEFRRLYVVLVAMVLALSLGGCSWLEKNAESKPLVVESNVVPNTISGYTRLDIPGGGTMFTRDAAVGVAGYDSVVPSKVGFAYEKRQKPLDSLDAKRLQEMLIGYSGTFLRKTMGQFVTSEPSACTVSLAIKLRELELYDSNVMGSQSTFVKDLGSAIIAIDISDSMSGKRIFTYMEKVKLGGGMRNSSGVDLKRLDLAIEKGLSSMAGRYAPHVLDGPVDARTHLGCEGKIGQARQKRYGGA